MKYYIQKAHNGTKRIKKMSVIKIKRKSAEHRCRKNDNYISWAYNGTKRIKKNVGTLSKSTGNLLNISAERTIMTQRCV